MHIWGTTWSLIYKKSSSLTTFACQFARNRFTRLPFGVAQTHDLFQQKSDEIFKDLPNIFGIADHILIVEYDADGRDHDRTQQWEMQICHREKLKQKQMSFRYIKVLLLGKVISREGVQPDLKKLCAQTKMAPININIIMLRFHELLMKILTFNCRGLWTT